MTTDSPERKEGDLAFLASEVRRHDRDRYVTALLAPRGRREALLALYAFNSELARIRESVREPLLGQMRLQWWRDWLAKVDSEAKAAHPAARVLTGAVAEHRLSRTLLERLIEARAADLDDGPVPNLDSLVHYAEETGGTLAYLAVGILGGGEDAAARRAAMAAGTAWALVGLLRSVPFHAAAGRLYLPADLLVGHGVRREDILTGRSVVGLRHIAEIIEESARRRLAEAYRAAHDAPSEVRAALLVAPMAGVYLRRLRRAGYDLMDRRWSAVRPPVLRLMLRAWTGRT